MRAEITVGSSGWKTGGKIWLIIPRIVNIPLNDDIVADYTKRYVSVSGDKRCKGDFDFGIWLNETRDALSLMIESKGGCAAGANVEATLLIPDVSIEGKYTLLLDNATASHLSESWGKSAEFSIVRKMAGPLDGKGACSISPTTVTAGESVDWSIECSTGGIAPKGRLSIGLPHAVYLSRPRASIAGLTEPDRIKDVRATTTSGLNPNVEAVQRTNHRTVDVLFESPISTAEKVIVTFPNSTFTLSGSWWAEVWTDADGDDSFAPIIPKPRFNVKPAPISSWISVGFDYLAEKKMAQLRLLPLDALSNPAPVGKPPKLDVAGRQFFFLPPREGGGPVVETPKESPDFEIIKVTVSGKGGGEVAVPVFAPEPRAPYRIYWGDLHGHCGLTDGSGSPEDYFTYAKKIARLDFAALPDHQQWLTAEQFSGIQSAAARATKPGKFIAIPGLELATWAFEHTNVYFPRSVNLTKPTEPDCDELFVLDFNGCLPPLFITDTKDLSRVVEETGAIVISHRAGTPGPFVNNLPPGRQPVVEIYSAQGSAEGFNDALRIESMREGDESVRDLIAKGRRLGFIGASDSHDGRPGLTSWGNTPGGLTAALAKDLTIEGIFEALRARRTYATTGARMPLIFKVNGHFMGEEFSSDPHIRIEAASTGNLEIHHFFKGSWDKYDLECSFDYCHKFTDLDFKNKPGLHVFYLRVTDSKGLPMAWSSPVWVTVRGG